MKSKAIMGEEKRIGKGKKHREEMFYSSGSNSKCSDRRLKPRIGCRMKSKSENSNSSDDSTDITIASLKKQSSSSSRQSRSRTKKPKYVSLRLQLSPRSTEKSKPQMPPTADELNLFPLHDPEKEDIVGGNILPPEHDVISRYFFTSTDGIATTLTGLLTAAAVDRENELDEEAASRYNWGTEANSGSGEGSSAAAAADQESLLVRTAMRNREREVGEVEKWVSISEVVEKDVVRKRSMSKEEEEVSKRWKSKEEEVSSRWCEGVDLWRDRCGEGGGVGLKLDYEQVLSAWSDKGRCSLYIGDGSEHQSPPPLQPQTVPEMGDDYLSFTSGAADFVSGLWSVPESRCSAKEEKSMEGGSNRSSKLGQREASVLRYKEKRQSRLFAKKIRYQVRKLNAEKRPRIKGRFVKRS